MMKVNASSNRQLIRAAVQQRHNQLDELVRELAPTRSWQGYIVYLDVFRQLHERYASSLAAVGRRLDLPDQDILPVQALHQDIADIEQHLVQADSSVRQNDIGSDRSADLGDAIWGHAYALEGSALGAKSLAREIVVGLPNAPTRFLDQMSRDVAARWPKVAAALNQSDLELTQIIAGALEVFEMAYSLFTDESMR